MPALPQQHFPNHTGVPNDEICDSHYCHAGSVCGHNGSGPLHRLRYEVPRGLVVMYDMDDVDQGLTQ